MNVTIDNLPIFFLIMVGIGVVIVLIGIMRLANHQDEASLYAGIQQNEDTSNLEELFSFFLQEEEKKNQNFREMVMNFPNQEQVQTAPQESQSPINIKKKAEKAPIDKEVFKEIIRRYDAGEDIESIARSLKKGTGEVKLIISLYAMR